MYDVIERRLVSVVNIMGVVALATQKARTFGGRGIGADGISRSVPQQMLNS